MSYIQYRQRKARRSKKARKRKSKKRKAPRLRLRSGVFHLTQVIGSKPVVMLYFAPGDPASETELRALQAFSRKLDEAVQCFGIVRVRNRRMLRRVKQRLRKLGITLPILLDWRGVLAYATLTRKLPSYAAVNRWGQLRLSQASALTEHVTPQHTLLQVIHKLAKGHRVPRIRAPGYSPNAYRLVGKTAPVVEMQTLFDKPSQAITVGKKTDRPTILVFWSITCPHCRKVMPQLQTYHQSQNNPRWQLYTVVRADNRAQQGKLKRFVQQHKLTFPLLSDTKAELHKRYHIQSYPTFLLLDTQARVRAVHFGASLPPDKLIPTLLQTLDNPP